MNAIAIPGTPWSPSCICLGTAEMGTVMSEADSFDMLDCFAEQGGSFLDSALVYGDMASDQRGMSEKTVGRWLKARCSRARMLVATKGAHPALQAMHIPRLSPADIQSDVEQSLHNLGMDCIDLYWLHRDDPNREIGGIIETLNDQVRAGKIRHYGLSNWQLARFSAAVNFARKEGLAAPVASQILWSLAQVNPGVITDPSIAIMGRETWEYHRRENIAVIPFTAQARGYFTKVLRGQPMADWVRLTYESAANFERLRRAQQLAKEHETSVEAVALAWLTSQPFATIPIISARDTSQLRISLAAGNLRLSLQELAYLDGTSNSPI